MRVFEFLDSNVRLRDPDAPVAVISPECCGSPDWMNVRTCRALYKDRHILWHFDSLLCVSDE